MLTEPDCDCKRNHDDEPICPDCKQSLEILGKSTEAQYGLFKADASDCVLWGLCPSCNKSYCCDRGKPQQKDKPSRPLEAEDEDSIPEPSPVG